VGERRRIEGEKKREEEQEEEKKEKMKRKEIETKKKEDSSGQRLRVCAKIIAECVAILRGTLLCTKFKKTVALWVYLVTAVKGGLDPNKISGVGSSFGLLVHVLPGPKKYAFELNLETTQLTRPYRSF
jgi:hypothetical protein